MTFPTKMIPFLREKHIQFIRNLDKKTDQLEYWLTEHLRISGIYWGLTTLDLIDGLTHLNREEVLNTLARCKNEDGGYGGFIGHDSHILYTLSAIQIYATYDALHLLNKEALVQFVSKLQNSDGSFKGDEWGEVDTRFSYCAISILKILNRLDVLNETQAIQFILSCQNFDGGFGAIPKAESHAGMGALAMLNKLDLIDHQTLGGWLSERQLPNGGLNGRPSKLEDVCYSWWVLSSLSMLGKTHWINKNALIQFILSSQDETQGGFGDRPGRSPDVFHTLFAISGLSLLGYEGLKSVDPIYCMSTEVVKRLKLNEF